MKKILLFLFLPAVLMAQPSNTYKYVINANGGVTVPVNTFKIGTVIVTRTGTQLNYVDATSSIQTQLNDKEAVLGNPSVTGHVLTSTSVGVRSWAAYATGTGSASGTNTGDNAVNTLYSGLVTFPGFGTSGSTAAVGNDTRLSDARVSNITPGTSGNIMQSNGSLWTSDTPIDYATVAFMKHPTITAKTASYVLALTDDGTVITMSSGTATTLTVPPNSSVAFPVGTQITLSCIGTGKTTVVAGSGVTIISLGSYLGVTVLGDVTLIKLATDTWKLIGSLE